MNGTEGSRDQRSMIKRNRQCRQSHIFKKMAGSSNNSSPSKKQKTGIDTSAPVSMLVSFRRLSKKTFCFAEFSPVYNTTWPFNAYRQFIVIGEQNYYQ